MEIEEDSVTDINCNSYESADIILETDTISQHTSPKEVYKEGAPQKKLDIDDLDIVCRVCLKPGEVTSLHKNKDYATFIFLLQTCHKSVIPVDNIYPSNICKACSLELQNISYFISKLKNTTEQLNVLFDEYNKGNEKGNNISKKNIFNNNDDDDNIEDNVAETIIIEEDVNEDIQEQDIRDISESSHGFKGFKCDPCNRKFNYFTSWQCHMIRHEEINKNKCKYCDWISIDEQKYCEHLKTSHTDQFISDNKNTKTLVYCDEYNSDFEMKPKKMASLTIDGDFKCNTCEITFKLSKDLRKHISTHIDNSNKQCEICGKIFVDTFGLQLHLETIHETLNRDNSKTKTRNRTRKSNDKPGNYNCEICCKQFVSKSGLNRHIQILHEQNKRFHCDVCGEKFTVKNSLKYHLYIHTDSKPFSCNLCSKAFRQPTALIRHQRTKHNNSKEFMCDMCLKMFKTSKGLENHRLKHNAT